MIKTHEIKYYRVHYKDGADNKKYDTLEEAETRKRVIFFSMLEKGFEPENMNIYLHNTVRIIDDEILITEVKTTTLVK